VVRKGSQSRKRRKYHREPRSTLDSTENLQKKTRTSYRNLVTGTTETHSTTGSTADLLFYSDWPTHFKIHLNQVSFLDHKIQRSHDWNCYNDCNNLVQTQQELLCQLDQQVKRLSLEFNFDLTDKILRNVFMFLCNWFLMKMKKTFPKFFFINIIFYAILQLGSIPKNQEKNWKPRKFRRK
jgi:hypothetical protein